MRRLVTWLLVTLGIAALVRRLRRRSVEPAPMTAPLPPAAGATTTDPADELRRKLAETRTEEPSGRAEAPERSVEDRRADVHAEGRAALEEMKPPDEG